MGNYESDGQNVLCKARGKDAGFPIFATERVDLRFKVVDGQDGLLYTRRRNSEATG
jgi:hypothetical protein